MICLFKKAVFFLFVVKVVNIYIYYSIEIQELYRNRALERTHCQSQPSPCSALINTSILSSYHSKLPKLHKCPKPVKTVTWLAPLRYFRPHRLSKGMYSTPLHPRQSPVRQVWKESLYSLLVEGFTAVFLKVFFFNNLTHDGSIYGAYLPLFTHIDHLKNTTTFM